MKISSNHNYISFSKQLYATCNTLDKERKPQSCFIYRIERDKDADYFQKLRSNPDWQNSQFLSNFDDVFREPQISLDSIYSIETEDENCIGYVHVSNENYSYNIEMLETAPSCTSNGKNKPTNAKYVGETLLSFVSSLAKRNDKKYITLESVSSASDFYGKKCHFIESPEEEDFFLLPNKRYDRLINQNKEHTGSFVNLLV